MSSGKKKYYVSKPCILFDLDPAHFAVARNYSVKAVLFHPMALL